jgi:hypothetical protein
MTFDMQAAQICAVTLGADTRIALKAALDEIERLQCIIDNPPEEADWVADFALFDRGTRSGLVEIEKAKKWHSAYRKAQNSNMVRAQQNESMAKRIAELEGNLVTLGQSSQLRFTEFQSAREKQHAALKKIGRAKRERGKALVEERAENIISGTSFCLVACAEEDVLGEEEECEYEGNCELAVCPNADWYRRKAREQLHQEGKL